MNNDTSILGIPAYKAKENPYSDNMIGHSGSNSYQHPLSADANMAHNSSVLLYNISDSCYAPNSSYLKKASREGMSHNMSFVGILKNKNGLVAFADRKSSYQIGNIFYPAGYTTKAYKGHNFLFVTYGQNEVNTTGGIAIPLQKVIEKVNPDIFSDYRNFFENLHQELSRLNAFFHTAQYNFIVGYKHVFQYNDELFDGYALASCVITRNGLQYTASNHSALYGGDLQFLPQVTDVLPDWSLEEMEDYAAHLVNDSIYYSSKLFGKNASIGGEPDIIILA